MNILYVAKHGCGGNEDELSIHYALEKMGHKISRVREEMGKNAHNLPNMDLCLFHKWEDPRYIVKVKCPKVFWFFDLVDYPDPILVGRNQNRMNWMKDTVPLVDMGFCTDGDWVENHNERNKLFWLPQGIDERRLVLNRARAGANPIVFTGIKRGGTQRQSFVDEMEQVYGADFCHVKKGVYGDDLIDVISKSQIMIAPDGPITDRYWSNRVYLTIGMGGFMLHPYCERLTKHYTDGQEIVYYKDRKQLHELIPYYRNNPEERLRIARAGAQRTAQYHTYRSRCELLISVVKERLGI